MRAGLTRLQDANLNRVREGLRVVEDICRFFLADKELQQRLKEVRHALSSLLPASALWQDREVPGDVGRQSSGILEYRREGLTDLVRANLGRCQEGLRVLEELAKLPSGAYPERYEELRYQCYQLEQEVLAGLGPRPLAVGLYLVLTDPPRGYENLAEQAVAAGIAAIQLRYKGEDDRLHLQLALALRELTRGSKTRFLVNDRPDIALMSGADGVHIGQEDLPAKAVRQLIGPRKLLGLSTHNLAQVAAAATEPVDYIGFGPIYATDSKVNPDPVTGPHLLPEAIRLSPHPVVAIGGLNLTRIAELPGGGSGHAAVIAAVSSADQPLKMMQMLHQQIQERV